MDLFIMSEFAIDVRELTKEFNEKKIKGVEASLIKYNPPHPFSSWIIRNTK